MAVEIHWPSGEAGSFSHPLPYYLSSAFHSPGGSSYLTLEKEEIMALNMSKSHTLTTQELTPDSTSPFITWTLGTELTSLGVAAIGFPNELRRLNF